MEHGTPGLKASSKVTGALFLRCLSYPCTAEKEGIFLWFERRREGVSVASVIYFKN
ncbi:MAG: hypothetical protein LBD82_05800 [Deltaproteobacteria bacterium]|jgi:hypothetical protein|nr:hypothetical protein [Deltaproteobacteria bacterium]